MDSIKKEEMGKSAVKALQVILVYIMPTLRTSRFLLQS